MTEDILSLVRFFQVLQFFLGQLDVHSSYRVARYNIRLLRRKKYDGQHTCELLEILEGSCANNRSRDVYTRG